jgi:hypothetical protein
VKPAGGRQQRRRESPCARSGGPTADHDGEQFVVSERGRPEPAKPLSWTVIPANVPSRRSTHHLYFNSGSATAATATLAERLHLPDTRSAIVVADDVLQEAGEALRHEDYAAARQATLEAAERLTAILNTKPAEAKTSAGCRQPQTPRGCAPGGPKAAQELPHGAA